MTKLKYLIAGLIESLTEVLILTKRIHDALIMNSKISEKPIYVFPSCTVNKFNGIS